MVTLTLPANTQNALQKIKLLLANGITIRATWLANCGATGLVHVRYWVSAEGGRFKPVEITVSYCPTHDIGYQRGNFPDGCPECVKAIVNS